MIELKLRSWCTNRVARNLTIEKLPTVVTVWSELAVLAVMNADESRTGGAGDVGWGRGCGRHTWSPLLRRRKRLAADAWDDDSAKPVRGAVAIHQRGEVVVAEVCSFSLNLGVRFFWRKEEWEMGKWEIREKGAYLYVSLFFFKWNLFKIKPKRQICPW